MGGTDRRKVLGRLMQVAPVLALVAIAGFALGACGGGGGGGGAALSTQTGLTRTTPTRTTPTRTTPTRTVTTSETTTETATTSETTTVPLVIPPATTSGESSSSSTPWGWIALGLALAAALVIGLVVWQRHRAGAAEWGAETADLNRRCLVALDDVLAKGSVVTGQIEALAAEAQAFEARPPTIHRAQRPPGCARARRPRRQPRRRQNSPARLPAAERGAALLLDGPHSPASRAASGRAAASSSNDPSGLGRAREREPAA